MDEWVNAPWSLKCPVHHKSREIRTTQPNLRTDPSPALVAVVAAVVVAAIVDIVVEVVVDRSVMVGAVVEPAVAVEQTAVVSDS